MSKYLWLLDNGHGGIINGSYYATCPRWTYDNPKGWNKMFVHGKKPIYEGVFNRSIVDQIARKLAVAKIDFELLVPENEDISLEDRVKRVNDLYKKDKRCILISIHGNAFNTKARGFEVFTSKGTTRSDKIAEVCANKMESRFQAQVMRWDLTDGDKDKESNFYILKETNCPAILTENFFFDNIEQAKMMMSAEGQDRIALAHFQAIQEIEKQGGY